MKKGDLVRFAMWGEFDHNTDWHMRVDKPHIGLLIEYDTLMKQATILYKGELYTKVRAQLVEKAGKKDVDFFSHNV